MKKIDFCDYPLGIGLSVWHSMKCENGVDVYQDDDGSIHIFPHKISFDEAMDSALNFLHRNNAEFFEKNIYYEHERSKTICIISGKRDKVLVGVARFNPSDKKYSHSIGQAIAYSRASGKKLPDDLAYYLGIKQ